jgi:hypothetical protein
MCDWAYSVKAMDPVLAPHITAIYYPFHSRYWVKARTALAEMKKRVGKENADDFKVLSLQVRLGDRKSWPLISCADNENVKPGHTENCNHPPSSVTAADRIMWLDLVGGPLIQLLESSGGPYDAIFIATNEPRKVRAAMENGNSSLLPSVFFLEDIQAERDPQIESIRNFLVEEIILVLSDRLIPSFPSSITEQLLRMRLKYRPNDYYDTELSKAYWDSVIIGKEFR